MEIRNVNDTYINNFFPHRRAKYIPKSESLGKRPAHFSSMQEISDNDTKTVFFL